MKEIFKSPIDDFIIKSKSNIYEKINSLDYEVILTKDEESCINSLVNMFKVKKLIVDFDRIEYTSNTKDVWDYERNPETWTTYCFKVPFDGDGNLLKYSSNNGIGTVTPYFIDGNFILFESVNFDLEPNDLNRNNRIEILKSMIHNLNKDYEEWDGNLRSIVKSYFEYRKKHVVNLVEFCKKYYISDEEVIGMEFKLGALEALSKIIADIYSGSEITTLFKKAGFPEIVHNGDTKWRFVCATFEKMQEESIEGFYKILKVLEVVCDPQEYLLNPEYHIAVLEKVNIVLSFYGFKFNEEGVLTQMGSVNRKLKHQVSEVNDENEEHYDVFISHSSTDKEWVNRLYGCLSQTDLKIWYDAAIISIGDNIREKINSGLIKSDFGIVVLSPDFIKRTWPKMEFDALYTLMDDGKLLPINHGLSDEELGNFFKPLLNIHYLSTEKYGLKVICDEIYYKVHESK